MRSCSLSALLGFAQRVPLHAQSANTFYKQGQAAEAREDFDAAFDDYQKAAAKVPNDLRFRERYLSRPRLGLRRRT